MIFKINRCNYFNVFEILIIFSKYLVNFRFILNLIYIEFDDFFSRFISFEQDLNEFSKKLTLDKILNFQSNNLLSFQFNIIINNFILFKLLNKVKISIGIVIIDVVVFYKLNYSRN